MIVGKNKRNEIVKISGEAFNQHRFAVGKSGCGKTTTALSQIVDAAEHGETSVVINWRRCLDHTLIHQGLRGRYERYVHVIDVAKDGIAIPLFTSEGDENDLILTRRISSLLKTAGNLSPTQESIVHAAVKAVKKMDLFPQEGISAIADWLRQQDKAVAANAAAKLRCIFEGNLIHEGDFWATEARIIEFDLNGLEYDDQLIIVRFLLDYVLRCANKGKFLQEKLNVFVDECQDLSYSDGSTICTMINETRKLNLRVMLATPEILDKRGMSVMRQCGCQMYFSPLEHERRKTAQYIDPRGADDWMFVLSRLGRGEYIACGRFEIEGKIVSEPVWVKTYFPELEKIEEV